VCVCVCVFMQRVMLNKGESVPNHRNVPSGTPHQLLFVCNCERLDSMTFRHLFLRHRICRAGCSLYPYIPVVPLFGFLYRLHIDHQVHRDPPNEENDTPMKHCCRRRRRQSHSTVHCLPLLLLDTHKRKELIE